MPALFIYLIKVNVALLIFCLGYYAILRHLTFYTLNRIYLVTAILFSTLYPKVDLTAFINRHEKIQVVVVNWQDPVKAIAQSAVHDQWYWLQVIFWIGVSIFSVRLLTQLMSLYRLHKQSEPAQIRHYVIRVIHGNINPFSFWRNIYINPANHAPTELDAILEHEHIHVSEWHTLDILLSEISAIFYWFNPGIWLMKRAIRENIEFITDRKILQKGVDSKAYQYSLLNVNFGAQSNAVVNHFNISTIKKRIIMMNAKRSSSVNITRYVFLVPVVVVLLLVFSVSKAELTKSVNKGSASVMRVLQAAAIKINLSVNPEKATNTTAVRKPMSALSAVSSFIIQHDTLPKGGKTLALDTNKSFKIIVRELGGSGAEPDIYIDGTKTPNGLATLDPNVISSVDVVKNNTNFPNGVIYVTTKGHSAATTATYSTIFTFDNDTTKKIKGKISDVVVRGYSTRSNSALKAVRVNGMDATDDIKKIVVDGDTVYTANIHTLTLTKGQPLTKVPGKQVKINMLTTTNVNGVLLRDSISSANSTGETIVRGYASNISGGGHLTSTSSTFQGASARNAPISFSDKLIIINGKEASAKELKKVSADKIESISNFTGDAATSKYGEKAKNGVVVITTKK